MLTDALPKWTILLVRVLVAERHRRATALIVELASHQQIVDDLRENWHRKQRMHRVVLATQRTVGCLGVALQILAARQTEYVLTLLRQPGIDQNCTITTEIKNKQLRSEKTTTKARY